MGTHPVRGEKSSLRGGQAAPRKKSTPHSALVHLGRWAVGLAAVFFPLVFATPVVPRVAALGLVCGLAGGVAALIAVVRDRERAVIVFAALAPLVIALAFGLAELISGNP